MCAVKLIESHGILNLPFSLDRLAYKNSSHLPYPKDPIPFRTFPDPRLTTGNHFKFIASSCILPNFPYLPFKANRIRGFDLLSDYVWPLNSVRDISSSSAPVTVELPGPVAEVSPQPPVQQEVVSKELSMSPEPTNTAGNILTAERNGSKSAPLATSSPARVLLPDLSLAHPAFMLLLGDFVYAEIPRYGGDDIEMYRRLYRRTYSSPSFRKVYERLRKY